MIINDKDNAALTDNIPVSTGVIKTPIGRLKISAKEYLIRISFLTEKVPLRTCKSILIHQIIYELNNYFKDPYFKFTIPYQISGSAFQKRVWSFLSTLPVGTTITYSELGQKLKTSPRSVGQACRTNALPLIIPCHRVIARYGIGGFDGHRSGKKIAIKQWLLNHETLTLAS